MRYLRLPTPIIRIIVLLSLSLGNLAAGQQLSPSPQTSPAPSPTLEQRVAGLEAYLNNGDPSKALQDKDGKVPDNLTIPSLNTSGPGHNAWMMTAAALVLFMTLPGLALFYGGLVRKKNALSVLAQCFGITGLVAILWWAFGYSLVFGKSFNSPFFGGSEYFFLNNVTSVPNTDYAFWVSQNVYAMYQICLLYTSPSPRDLSTSRMPSSA